MVTTFPTEYLFRRLSDFWSFFQDRDDVKNIWDAYTRKSQALNSLLLQADLSKSLKTIPLFDRNDLEYFVFPSLVRRTDLEANGPFYVFEVDPTIFYVRNLNEKIDDVTKNRVMSAPEFFDVLKGTGGEDGKVFLRLFRGVAPVGIGETQWVSGSDLVTGVGLAAKLIVGDILQGQNQQFFKVAQVLSDTQVRVQGPTTLGEDLGPGDGVTLVFAMAATANVVPSSAELFFDGVAVPPANFTVTPSGTVVFVLPPPATVGSITANYYLGYTGVTATSRRTSKESLPVRLLSHGVYRDRRSIFTNFGTAIGVDKPTSFKYLNEVRGIYFARYNGPTAKNMDLGSGILIELPFSERGKVTALTTIDPKSVIVSGAVIPVQPPLTIGVTVGQELARDFNLLTDGVRTADFINAPDIFGLAPLKTDPAKFFTFFVIVDGAYATFVATQTGQPIDYTLLKRFKGDIKPTYTDCRVLTNIDFLQDSLNFFIGAVDATQALDATCTLEFNCINYSVITTPSNFLAVNGYADEAALVAAGVCNMDCDSIGIVENVEPFLDSLGISTLEGNLVNFGVSLPGPTEAMDESTVPLVEGLTVENAISTPPGSGIPPYVVGPVGGPAGPATIYSF